MTVKETLDSFKNIDESLKREYVGNMNIWSDEKAIGALILMLKNKKFSDDMIMTEINEYNDILCNCEDKELEETYKNFIQYMKNCAKSYFKYIYDEYEIEIKEPHSTEA